jgi:hypothetical protein
MSGRSFSCKFGDYKTDAGAIKSIPLPGSFFQFHYTFDGFPLNWRHSGRGGNFLRLLFLRDLYVPEVFTGEQSF